MTAREDDIIAEITKIRTKNNVLWMELLRLAVLRAPDEAKPLIRQINLNDLAVSELTGKLAQ